MEAPREKKKKKRGGDNITWSNIHVIKISEGEEWEEKNIWRNKGWKISKLIKKKKSTYKYKDYNRKEDTPFFFNIKLISR